MKRTSQPKTQRAQSNVFKGNNQDTFIDLAIEELSIIEIDAADFIGRPQGLRFCICMCGRIG